VSEDEAMLARIDERLKHLERDIEDLVTRIEFQPIKLSVYGLIGLLLSALIGAIVAGVLR
jgi:hypothetical protein